MGANLKRTLICDVEATCWETPGEQGLQPNEVIEIGICELNLKTGEIHSARSYPVKPCFTSVSNFCTRLTGWTQEKLKDAPTMKHVLSAIKSDYGITRLDTWWSYGEYDRFKLSGTSRASVTSLYGAQFNLQSADNPFDNVRAHFNVKTLFAMRHGLSKEVGMAEALRLLKEPLEGQHHSGRDDAYNTAKIVRYVLGLPVPAQARE